jgi:hypothetical protein
MSRLMSTHLSRTLGVEAALLVLVLGVAALLSSLPPARDTAARNLRASQSPAAMSVLVESANLNISFGVTPNRVGDNTLLLELTDTRGNTVLEEAQVTVRLFRLDQAVTTEPLRLQPQGPGRYAAASTALSIVGAWHARVTLYLPGQSSIDIDYLFRVAGAPTGQPALLSSMAAFLTGREPELPRTGPLVPPDASEQAGLELLQQADASMNRLTSLYECNNINGVVTLLEYSAPDRMAYTVRGGGSSVIVGMEQWHRRGESAWQTQPRGSSFRFPEFSYAEGAQGVRWEASTLIDTRLNHLISFYSPQDDADYLFWIDDQSHRLNRLVMNVPPSHYMVSAFGGFNEPNPLQAFHAPEELAEFSAPAAPESQREVCDDYLP